jgi:hypothetical protein
VLPRFHSAQKQFLQRHGSILATAQPHYISSVHVLQKIVLLFRDEFMNLMYSPIIQANESKNIASGEAENFLSQPFRLHADRKPDNMSSEFDNQICISDFEISKDYRSPGWTDDLSRTCQIRWLEHESTVLTRPQRVALRPEVISYKGSD